MNAQPIIGIAALAAAVVGMVLYRVFWALGRERRRNAAANGKHPN